MPLGSRDIPVTSDPCRRSGPAPRIRRGCPSHVVPAAWLGHPRRMTWYGRCQSDRSSLSRPRCGPPPRTSCQASCFQRHERGIHALSAEVSPSFSCPSCCRDSLGPHEREEPARLIAEPEGSCRDLRVRDRRMSDMSNARRDDGIRKAQAARERGRAKVRSTTTAVTMASVVTAGALALALPGSTHKTSTSSNSGCHLVRLVELLGQLRLHQFGLHQFRLHQFGLHWLQLQAPAPAPPDRVPRAPRTPARVPAASAPAPRRPQTRAAAARPPLAAHSAGHRHGRRRVGELAGPRHAGPAGGDRTRRPARSPPLARKRPRRGRRGLQPVPRRLRDPRPRAAASSGSARCWPRPSRWRCGPPG